MTLAASCLGVDYRWLLHHDKLLVATVFGIQFHNGMGGSETAGKEVQHDVAVRFGAVVQYRLRDFGKVNFAVLIALREQTANLLGFFQISHIVFQS